MQNWLYDISERMQALSDTLEMFDGDDSSSEDIKSAIEEVYDKEVVPAVQDGIQYIEWQQSLLDTLDNKIKRLQALKKSREGRLNRVKNGYMAFMKSVGSKKIETVIGNMSVAKTAGRLIVDSIDKLPPEYTVSTVTVSPNKVAIKEAIKRGEVVEGAHIEEGESLRIK